MSHTPGPWTYDEESNEVYRLDSAGHVEACLCEIRGEPNWRDNARLIAAAPDLLKALQFYANESNWEKSEPQFACDCLGPSPAENDGGAMAMVAIRKALGESHGS